MSDLKNCEISDEERKMEVLRKMRYDWYIAPYYGSKEQYLFARCQDCNITGGYSEVMNFGEIKHAKLSKEELSAFSTELGSVLRKFKNSGDEEYATESIPEGCKELSGIAKELIGCMLQENA